MKLFSLLILISVTLWTGNALKADSITVQNFSFEDPTLGTDQYTAYSSTTVDTIPGWTNGAYSGVQHMSTPTDPNPNGGYDYLSVPDGVNAAYDDTSSPISQILSATLAPGEYTLTIAVGYRNNHNFDGGDFGLYTANGTMLDSMAVTQPVQGTFQDETLTYDVTASNLNLGQQLQIELGGAIGGGQSNYADYDDVRLNFTAAPEPSTCLLLGVGMMAAVAAGAVRRNWVRA
jgi:hypothetical protein